MVWYDDILCDTSIWYDMIQYIIYKRQTLLYAATLFIIWLLWDVVTPAAQVSLCCLYLCPALFAGPHWDREKDRQTLTDASPAVLYQNAPHNAAPFSSVFVTARLRQRSTAPDSGHFRSTALERYGRQPVMNWLQTVSTDCGQKRGAGWRKPKRRTLSNGNGGCYCRQCRGICWDEIPESAEKNTQSQFTASGAEEGNTSEGTQCGIPQPTVSQFMDHFVDNDPDRGQSCKVRRGVLGLLSCRTDSRLFIFVVVHERHTIRSLSRCVIKVCVNLLVPWQLIICSILFVCL